MTSVRPLAGAAQQSGLPLGARVRWQVGTYRVVALQGAEVQLGCLDEQGHDARALVAAVVGAADYALLDDDGQVRDTVRVAGTSGLSLLSEAERAAVRDWERHLREIDEGVPPDAAEGTVPRPNYDPARFTVRQRIAAKGAEIKRQMYGRAGFNLLRKRVLPPERTVSDQCDDPQTSARGETWAPGTSAPSITTPPPTSPVTWTRQHWKHAKP